MNHKLSASAIEIKNRSAIAVIRLSNPNDSLHVTEALLKGGVSSIEITLSTPNTFEVIDQIAKHFHNDAFVGIGSVTHSDQVKNAVNAGAKYVVSPIFKHELLETAKELNVLAMPGCFTPTEIQTAYEAGAEIIKVFPADRLGMSYFKSIKAPLPHLNLVPTGGVSLTNAGEWIESGAFAVGLGGALIDKAAIEEKNFDVLTENAKTLIRSIKGN